ncbi:MAG: hypothetical protein ABSB26_07610 [Nitrososphaerales archaeon]|jgi:hypothetical protein
MTETRTSSASKTTRAALVVVLIVIMVGLAVSYEFYLKPSTGSSSSSTCSGSPPVGDCAVPYSYPFTLSVNYSGPWRLSYQGYLSSFGPGKAIPTNVTGSYSGTGFYSKNITLSGPGNYGLELCASAQKLDGSGSSLILKITGRNETSLPYGSVTYCGGVAP